MNESEGAFTFGAGLVATTDAAELLVYNPEDEAPRWKKKLGAPIVGTGAIGDDEIAVVDADGTVTRLAAADGAVRGTTALDAPARAMAVSRGKLAVALDDKVVVLDGHATKDFAVGKARALAFAGERLAIGTDDGKLVIVGGEDERIEGEVGDPVRGVARHPKGFWLVTAGDRVLVVDDKGESARFTRTKDSAPSAIAVSPDGTMVAVKLDARSIAVLTHPSKETVLTATYADREPVGVAFTEDGAFVWIGVGKGDANKIELDTEDVYRTDPHPGRARATWVLRVAVDKAVRAKTKAQIAQPKAPASPAASSAKAATETSAAPHAEIAEARPPSGPREPVLPPSPRSQVTLVLAVLSLSAIVALLSLKCG